MSPVHFAIAAIPVAVYLIMVGALRLRRHPLVTTGWRDTLTLGIAVSGLVAIGPMQLFFPTHAAAQWHGWVWMALLILYLLALLMVLLSCRPRLIAYGMNENTLRTLLLQAAVEVDAQANWHGEILTLPESGMQLALEATGSPTVSQVVHVGLLHNLDVWLKLEKAFVKIGRQSTCPPSRAGWPIVIVGSLIFAAAIMPMLSNPAAAIAQLREFLSR